MIFEPKVNDKLGHSLLV